MQAIYFSDIRRDYIGHICAEIFRDGVYEPYFAGKQDLVILDVGAHVGIFSLYASVYSKIIYALEPAHEHFQSLVAMIKFNRLENVKSSQLAITNKNEKRQLFHFAPDGQRLQRTAFNLVHGNPQGAEMVDCVTLDKFFKDNKIEKVDFMKLDVEGSEFEILGGDAFTRVADKIDTIYGEIHYFAGRHYGQIKQSLENRNYEVEFPEGLPASKVPYWGEKAITFVAKRK